MLKNEAEGKIILKGEPKQGLAKLIGHAVQIDLMPALGAHNYMPETYLRGFDAVSLEIDGGGKWEFIPLMRVVAIRHADYCRTSNDEPCEGIDAA